MLIWLNVLNKKSIHPVKRICAYNICERKFNSTANSSLRLALRPYSQKCKFWNCLNIFQWKLSSSGGGELGQTKHRAPKQFSVLWIYSKTCSRKRSTAYSDTYTHIYIYICYAMLCSRFSELFGFFLRKNLRSATRIHTKSIEILCSHRCVFVAFNTDKPWTCEFISRQFYCKYSYSYYYFFFNRYFCRECFSDDSPPMWMLILFIFFSYFLFSLASIQFLFSFIFVVVLFPSPPWWKKRE